jgi:hypothetical protein
MAKMQCLGEKQFVTSIAVTPDHALIIAPACRSGELRTVFGKQFAQD